MKTFKTNRPFLVKLHNRKKNTQFALGQIFCVMGDKCYVQGRETSFSLSEFEQILSLGNLTEVNDVTQEYLQECVLPHPEYLIIKKVLKLANRSLSEYGAVIKTLKTWAFLPKGSKAVNIEDEIQFQSNPEKILSETILGDGIKAKPGSFIMNRGLTRCGAFVKPECEVLWENDRTTLLPYGIRQSDFASQTTQVKIFKKLVQQTISMEDCPNKFKVFFEEQLDIVSDLEPFKDYLRFIDPKTGEDKGFPKLLFKDFYKNEHHSKENGLELCHLNPWIEFATVVDNITIGSSRANRLQGGYPIKYLQETFR